MIELTWQDKRCMREIPLSSFEVAVKVYLEHEGLNDAKRLQLIKESYAELVAKLEQLEAMFDSLPKSDPFKN